MKVFCSLILMLIMASCADNNRTQSADQKATSIHFQCQKAANWTEDLPRHEVHLMIDKQDVLVAVINSCDLISTATYQQYDIPAQAIAACGGWWAGAGDYLYAITEDGDINVYKGSQDEGQTAPGFGYQKIRTISPEDL